jgi:type IV secretion system protein VirB10
MPEQNHTPETPPSRPQSSTESSTASLRDRRIKPEGVVPKEAQGYLIAGLSVLILLAVLFSKNHNNSGTKAAWNASEAMSNDANQRKIQELEEKLTEDQRQSQGRAQGERTPTSPNTTAPQIPSQAEPPHDPIADAERELSFKARFASNIVSAYGRREALDFESTAAEAPPAATTAQIGSAVERGRDEVKHAPEVSVNSAHGQPFVLFEGTTIDTALVNRLDGEFTGPVKVMVTNPVYSQDRQHVLIPEGTFVLGDVRRVSGFGQRRLAVIFHRMIMPDGYSVDLDQFHGLDQAAATGLKDKVNNHYLEIFGASIALGVIAGATESTTYGSYTESGINMYRQGVASSLSQSGANVLERFINIPPTITIREGHRLKVYLTQDLLLPAYENHTIPGDI